jgi:hypothetical protein
VDILLFHARQLGVDQIGLVTFLNVDTHFRGLTSLASFNRADKKTAEQVVEWVIASYEGTHLTLLA